MAHDSHDHHHGHHHDNGEHSDLSETALRVKALESLLVEKGYVDPAALDELIRNLPDARGPAQWRPGGGQGLE